jgi:hypothetical protein
MGIRKCRIAGLRLHTREVIAVSQNKVHGSQSIATGIGVITERNKLACIIGVLPNIDWITNITVSILRVTLINE